MVKEFLSYRSHAAALILLLVFSLVATQVPLFNYLGYEFSALIALFWSLIAGLLTISLWNKSAEEQRKNVGAFARRSLELVLLALLVPLAIISLNALFVKNCSFLQGAVLFLLIVPPAVIFSHALALTFATGLQWKKTGFVLAWIAVLSHIAYVTFTRPQIFAFNPLLGYFAGLTYDEALDVTGRLALYRVGTIAFSVFLVLSIIAIRQRRLAIEDDLRTTSHRIRTSVMITLAAIVLLLFVLSNRLGFSSSESFIRTTLGGVEETEHFVITYPDTLLTGVRLEQVVQLHEFYYEQLTRILRVRPLRKIHTFLYASQDQKGRLIGASGTDFAKPWLWQLHINVNDVEGSLRHELVHVLAADFGFPLFRVGVNSGFIEGLAVAVDRSQYEEPIHRLAAMALMTNSKADVGSLFSLTGFLKAPAGMSYTLAGSFCRFLIDRYGMRRFKLVYATGEYSIIYGRPLSELLHDWRRSLSGFQFTDGDLAKAEYLFNRRSIFGKVCARVIANVNKDTRTLLSERRFDDALGSASRSLSLTMSAEAVFQKTTALVRLGRFAEAAAFARGAMDDSRVAPSLLTLKLLLGDAYWGIDSLEQALKIDSELLRAHLSMGWDESIALRLDAFVHPELAAELKPYFLNSQDDSTRLALLEKSIRAHPKVALPKYLLARELSAADRPTEAIALLDALPVFSSPILELSRQRRLAQLSFALGEYEKAKIYYWQSLNFVFRDALSQQVEERLRFCDWMETFTRGED